MTHKTFTPELLTLFKALADKSRLKIIGLLAQKPHAVEDIATSLKLGASTVSHHLTVLGKAGLVSAKAEGYYSIYSLQSGQLENAAKALLKHDKVSIPAEHLAADDYDRKVLATFTEPDGRIKAFPVQERKFLVLLRTVLREFEPGMRYSEKKVNEILSRFNEDTARLRRALVEYKFMAREGGGGKYWRIDES